MLLSCFVLAFAQTTQGGAPAGATSQPSAASALSGFLPLLLIGVAFFFLILWPQQKAQKQHKKVLEELKKGDHVVTRGGIHGTIVGFEDQANLMVRIANNVEVKIVRSAIDGLVQEGKVPQS